MPTIETVYPLSPMQEGILFHSLDSPGSGEYFRQLSLTLEGNLDTALYRQAWDHVAKHHAALRTALVWENVKQPAQAVFQNIELPWADEDWCGESVEHQRDRLAALLEQDRARGFDLRVPPLIRCTLVRMSGLEVRFVLSFHHAVLDGWSVPVLLRDVFTAYDALLNQRMPTFVPSPSHRDFLVWLKRQNRDAARAFWTRQLSGFDTATKIGFAPGTSTKIGYGETTLTLDPEFTAQLRAKARDLRVTFNALLQSAWALLLSRYSGNTDVVFGAVVSGRPAILQGIERTAGMFVNTIPVRAQVKTGVPFSSLARELQLQAVDAREFENTALTDVREWINFAARQPLFETLFVFENYPPLRDKELGSVRLTGASSYERTTIPLTLTITAEEQLSVLFTYDSSRFDSAVIGRISNHLQAALENILLDADTPVSRLEILPAAESAQLDSWNATARDWKTNLFIPDLLSLQAAETPNTLALRYEDCALTYRELQGRVNRLANFLRANGGAVGSLVGVYMERSVEMVVALVATLKAGCAYVPLDPEYPHARIAMMLDDAKPVLILTQAHLRDRLAPNQNVLAIDANWDHIAASPSNPPPFRPEPDDVAYVIYTSGSTGVPKGAANTHAGLKNRLLWMQDQYGLDATDRVLQKTPYSFDVSVWEFFWPLITGAALVVAPPAKHRDPAYLASIIEREAITTVHFVPSMLEAFLDSPGSSTLPSLRRTICSGEALPAPLTKRFFERLPRVELHNLYGPTEAAIDVTLWPCRADWSQPAIPIGYPVANTEIRILDADLNRTPIGIPGELHIGGVQVCRGYLNRPELTASKFIADPFRPGERLYKTGDLARYREDGAIEYLGRSDDQVKVRGFRIELGEIESRLRAHPSVREAAVLSRADGGRDKRLVAYVTTAGAFEPTSLRDYLKTVLPEYMVPAIFVKLDEMPLSANGKLDRKRLPEPSIERANMRSYIAPRTEAEQILAGIWAKLLRINQVGAEDDFFELGGDSILSMQVIARAATAGLRLTTKQVFEHSRLDELAQIATKTGGILAEQGTVTGAVPLTAIEHWWLETPNPEPSHFNQAVVLELKEIVSPEVIERALHKLVAHHDALRLRLRHSGSGWTQVITASETTTLLWHETLSTVALADRNLAIEEAGTRANRSLDLERGPLLRAIYFDCGQDPAQLLIAIHHVAVDGVSWRILIEDLATVCTGASLPPKTTSLLDWARAAVRQAKSEAVEKERAFWMSQTAPTLNLPKGTGSGRLQASLPLPALADTRNVLLASLATALLEVNASQPVAVDLEGHGRDSFHDGIDVSRTVGWFTSVYPLLLDSGEVSHIKDRIKSVPSNGLHFGLLNYLSSRPVRHRRSDVLFNYLGQFDQAFADNPLFNLSDAAPGEMRSSLAASAYRLEVNASVRGGKLNLYWSFSDVEQGVAETLFERFIAHLHALTTAVPSTATVEDTYALSPMQQGMLFHGLYESGSAAYVEQLTCVFEGAFEPARFESAWQELINRHPALRTVFVWEGIDQPMQSVVAAVQAPVHFEDWSGYPGESLSDRSRTFIERDRRAPFALDQAPLMRVTIIRQDESHARLVWSWSHLLMDGWCLPVLLKELFSLYQCQPLPAAPTPYREYIDWLHRQDQQKAAAFWSETLHNFVEPTPLPLAYHTPRVEFAGEDKDHRLETSFETAERLRAFARENRITLNTLVQGAWAILLMRCTGRRDVVFGATTSGRPAEIPGVDSAVGLFINTLPVRATAHGDEPIADWLRSLQKRQAAAHEFEFAPLSDVQRASELPPGASLFESVVVFQNYPVDESALDCGLGLRVTDLRIFEQGHYPLHLVAVPGKRILLRLLHDPARIAEAAAQRLLRMLEQTLASMAANPDMPVRDLGVLSESDRADLIRLGSGPQVEYPRSTIHCMFEQCVDADPSTIALSMGDFRLTYAQLDARANAIACVIGEVRPGTLIGLCAERSVDLIAGMLAILKAGGAYVSIDPTYPEERISWMLEDSRCDTVVTQSHLLPRLDRPGVRMLLLDKLTTAGSATSRPRPASSPADPAFLIYTSGSTGNPKGVLIRHAAVVNMVRDTSYPLYGPGEVFMQYAPVTFDASTIEIWGALLNRSRLALPPPGDLSLGQLGTVVRDEKVTVLFLTAGVFHLMVENQLQDLAGLRYLLSGGDVISANRIQRVLNEVPFVRFMALYGPTESTTYVSYCGIANWNLQWETTPIGRPIANTTLLVLDDCRELVPRGAPGELYIGGDSLSMGYWEAPELTQSRFITNPYGEGLVYKTGDLVRWLEDGNLEFLGRADRQVKIRGFRIEPGEIEERLSRHPQVEDSVVAVHQDAHGGKSLVAYAACRNDAQISQSELKAFLAARLPAYMVPAHVVVLDRLPLSPSGKIDRNALPTPGEPVSASFTPPFCDALTETEQVLADIWRKLLGRATEIGPETNFFDLGGDSIQSLRIIASAAKAGLKLTPKDIFEKQTLRDIAAAGTKSVTTKEHVTEAGDAALTPIQQWFFEQPGPNPNRFTQTVLLNCVIPVDADALGNALAQLVRVHPALSLKFENVEGGWRQFAGHSYAPRLECVNLTETPERLMASISALEQSLDLKRGRLVAAGVYDLPAGEQRVAIAIHHLAVDGVSWRVLLEDLDAAYSAGLAGVAAPLSPEPTSFLSWARQASSLAASEPVTAEAAYWSRFAETPIALRLDNPGGANTVELTAKVSAKLHRDETGSLLARASSGSKLRVNELLIAALGPALRLIADSRELLIDVEGHGRNLAEENGLDISRTVGWFTSLFPVAIPLGPTPNADTAAMRMAAIFARVPRQGSGFGLLKYLHRDPLVREDMSRIPSPLVSFNYLGQFDSSNSQSRFFSPADEELAPSLDPLAVRRHVIDIVAAILNGRFEVRLEYSRELHSASTIKAVLDRYMTELRRLIEGHSATPVSSGIASGAISRNDLSKLFAGMKPAGGNRK